MIKVDRKKFWNGYKTHFVGDRTLTQDEVDGVNYFLDRFENESRLKNIPQHAYVLATAYHESGKPKRIGNKKVMVRFQPVSEGRESLSSPRRANQDRYWKTGFYGRGYPQTTWQENYLKSGQLLGLGDLFVREPDLLMKNDYAYDAMVASMQKGAYRKGKSLDRYLPNASAAIADYVPARDIINGDIQKNGRTIGNYAVDFADILKASKLPAAASTERDTTPSQVLSNTILAEQAENVSAPAFEQIEGLMNEAEEIQGKAESSVDKVTEKITETINTGAKQIERETSTVFDKAKETIDITTPASTGFVGKIWKTIGGVFTGAIVLPAFLQDGFDFKAILNLIAPLLRENFKWILFCAMFGLAVWYVTKKINSFQLTKLKANINTDDSRKDIQFVDAAQPESAIKSLVSKLDWRNR